MDVVDRITLHYRENFSTLASKAGRILRDHAFGEDCVQEAVEACLKYKHTFSEEKGDFDKWFNKIFWRTINRYKSFSKGQEGVDYLLEIEIDPAISLLYLEDSRLSDNYKKIIHQIYVMGYTPKEVSELLGENSIAVVYKAVHLFKKEVKQKYAAGSRFGSKQPNSG
jgi:DNA-directed RNA polymerase specialized sigma24 family protein